MISYTFTRQDGSGENTSTTFNTSYDFNVTDNSTLLDAYTDLRAALDAIAAAQTYRAVFTVVPLRTSPVRAGHRELKWVLRFRDAVGRIYNHEVGTANISLPRIHVGGRTLLDPAWSGYNAFRNRLQGHVTNPYGQSLTLVEVEEVGRNI